MDLTREEHVYCIIVCYIYIMKILVLFSKLFQVMDHVSFSFHIFIITMSRIEFNWKFETIK